MDSGDILFGLTFAGALGAGLVAGVFYAFSSFVMPGLKRLPTAEAVAAMQSINVTAVRPAFMAGFLGTTVLAAVLGVWGSVTLDGAHGRWLLTGGLLYVGGCFILTAAYHVPRNNGLAGVEPSRADSPDRWAKYHAEWVRWNHVRGLASLTASGAFIAALLEI